MRAGSRTRNYCHFGYIRPYRRRDCASWRQKTGREAEFADSAGDVPPVRIVPPPPLRSRLRHHLGRLATWPCRGGFETQAKHDDRWIRVRSLNDAIEAHQHAERFPVIVGPDTEGELATAALESFEFGR